MVTYEERLDRDLRWALAQGSLHFEEANWVHEAFRRIAARLKELDVSFALAGAMAMFFHGCRRFTENIDLLVTRQSLDEIHRRLVGRGYVPASEKSRDLRDAEYSVLIRFLVAGEYPGDRKPKPVCFPDPLGATEEIKGFPCLKLPPLLETYLAAGMSHPAHLCGLAEAIRLIETLHLPRELASELSPYVRDKYVELWEAVQNNPE